MKALFSGWLTALGAGILMGVSEVRANVLGSDNFNDNSRNVALWSSPVAVFGAGDLQEIRGRLEFTSTATQQSYIEQDWSANTATYGESFEVQIDTTVLQDVATTNGYISFGIEVGFGSGANSKWVDVDHGAFGDAGQRGFDIAYGMGFGNVPGNLTGTVGPASTSQRAAVRLTYDAPTHVLSAFYDEDGGLGNYQWTLIASVAIDGSNPALFGNVNWGMNAADAFYISPYGYSDGEQVTAQNVYGDNFGIVPEPGSLGLAALGAGVLVLPRRKRAA